MQLSTLGFTLMSNLKKQRNFMKNTLYLDVEKSKKNADNTLNERDYKKITDYYGLAVPAFLGNVFAGLREDELEENERRTLTYLGGITGLFDDFFDKTNFSNEHILKLVEEPEIVNTTTEHERLFVEFYIKALESSANPDQIIKYFHDVFDAQVLSKKQEESTISDEEIKSITLQKGGVSLVVYRSGMNKLMNEDERNFLYQFGSLLQLENDIFDIYKDYQDSIKTLATIETNMDNLRKTYNSLFEETCNSVVAATIPSKSKKRFLRTMSMIISRGFVCLDMLKSKEALTENRFEISHYERKDLICDMEKPSNFLKSIYYYSKTQV